MIAKEVLAGIRMLACDVDGVLTDGTITYGSGNLELKSFNIKDGLAIKLAVWSGLPVYWLTGRSSDAVVRRAAELDVQLVQGATDKDAGLRQLARDTGIDLAEIAYIGDDLNDLPALRLAGLPIAVADAAPEVIAAAAWVTRVPGGRGAVREAIEAILEGQGRWENAIDIYLARLGAGKSAQ